VAPDGGPPAGEEGPLGPTPAGPPAAPTARRDGALLAAAFVAVLGCLVVFGIVATAATRAEADALDTVGNPFMHGLASPLLDAVMTGASVVGSDWVLVPLAAACAIALWRIARRREALFLVAALGGSILLNAAMKLVFHRARPSVPWARVLPDYSFPSGHSMNSLALGLALSFVVWRLFGRGPGLVAIAIALAAAAVIGLSRVYLGFHYPTDVIGGFASAVIWVLVAAAILGAPRRSEAN
jgi:membrane-associated phospholipid phosphatase